MRLALFQPDIPQNTGTILRFCACMKLGVDIIEPCGFVWDDRKLRRAGLDYIDHVDLKRHLNWEDFFSQRHQRIILLSTKAASSYIDFAFHANDILLFGRESAGVPDHVHEAADARLCVPMAADLRALNVAVCASMVAGEAMRQTQTFPLSPENSGP